MEDNDTSEFRYTIEGKAYNWTNASALEKTLKIALENHLSAEDYKDAKITVVQLK